MSRSLVLLLLLAAGVALLLRLPRLDQRPMHNDEAVNAIKFGRLWDHHAYRYDPNEHHGPTLYYATAALGRLTAAPDFDHYSECRLRLVTVLFGAALILLLPTLADGLGRHGTIWAGLFLAVSPAMVFYSRYYIHEILLVCFTLLAMGAGWRYWRARKAGWILAAGIGLGLMYATKETFVLSLGAAGGALLLNYLWGRVFDASEPPAPAAPLNRRHLAAGAIVALIVAALFFSSFFTNASGLLDSIKTYQPWLNRAGGDSPHTHPWFFYFHRLLWFHPGKGPVWTEAAVLVLALVAGYAGFARRWLEQANAGYVRWLFLFTALLAGIYTLLPYKTPWCLLNFWLGVLLLAGVGAAVVLRLAQRRLWRGLAVALLLTGAAHLAWQAWRTNTDFASDQRNPYVYAQTAADLNRLVAQVRSLAAVSPAAEQMLIKVITYEGDCWPLPWYLRQFKQAGWWEQMPADPYAPVMIVSARLRAELDEKKTHLMTGLYELRPGVFLELYVQLDLWRAWLEKRPPPAPDP